MKRAAGLSPQVVAFDALAAAARRAARGKRRQRVVARFLADLEPEVLALQRELAEGRWAPGTPTSFEIHDPKRRTITAPCFRDRVVHHALVHALEPTLERRMIHESFACRRGKGTHAAVEHARRLVRRYRWSLKLDIARCFDSLRHDVVEETVARCVKDGRAMALVRTILQAGGSDGRGLPIGALTSQWFANLTLDRLDHHVKEALRVPGYVRYMDDFVLFSDDREHLRVALGEVRAFVEGTLDARLKERATRLAPTRDGLPFLGWNLYPSVTRIRRGNLRRLQQRVRHRFWEARTGRIDGDRLEASLRAVCEHLRHGDTLALRRRWFGGAGDAPGPRAPPPRGA